MNYNNLFLNAVNQPDIEGLRKIEQGKYTIFALDNGPESSVNLTEEYINKFKNIRGVIFETDTKKLVFRSIPYVTTMSLTEFSTEFENLSISLENMIIIDSLEGSLIRIFYDKEDCQWIISTTKKIDAYKSKWKPQGQSFGEMFETSLIEKYNTTKEEFLKELDINLQYIFFLSGQKSTKLVCSYDTDISTISLLSIIDKNTDTYQSVLGKNILGVEAIKPLNIKTKDEIVEKVKSLTYPFKSQGLVVLNPNTMDTIKILNDEYYHMFKLRKGHNSIPFSFLFSLEDRENVKLFYKHFPELSDTFDVYLQKFKEETFILFNLYREKFAKFKKDEMDERIKWPCYSKALSFCSDFYMNNKKTNDKFRLNIEHIKYILYQNPTLFNQIMNYKKKISKTN